MAVVALVSLSLFVWIELTVEAPLIRLRLLKRRNFGFGTIAVTTLGFALFGSVYILPAYLGQTRLRATMPSRSAPCWRRLACRNCC